MAHPTHYTPRIAIPPPSDADVRRIIGKSNDPEKTLDVIKMFAGTEKLFRCNDRPREGDIQGTTVSTPRRVK